MRGSSGSMVRGASASRGRGEREQGEREQGERT